MTDPIRTVIGFDYGSHWIGIALGQTLTLQARPLDAVRNGDWDAIERVIEEWRPERLIVGLPLNMKSEAQEMSAAAERFARRIAENGPLAVRAVKQSVIESLSLPLEEAFRREIELATPVFKSQDALEGPLAFMQKRKPEFRGK